MLIGFLYTCADNGWSYAFWVTSVLSTSFPVKYLLLKRCRRGTRRSLYCFGETGSVCLHCSSSHVHLCVTWPADKWRSQVTYRLVTSCCRCDGSMIVTCRHILSFLFGDLGYTFFALCDVYLAVDSVRAYIFFKTTNKSARNIEVRLFFTAKLRTRYVL